jgi:hypothetical protein
MILIYILDKLFRNYFGFDIKQGVSDHPFSELVSYNYYILAAIILSKFNNKIN